MFIVNSCPLAGNHRPPPLSHSRSILTHNLEYKEKSAQLFMEESTVSLDRLRSLCLRISELPTNEHCDVLKIIKSSGVDITENDNGTFVDLCAMPFSMISELEQMIKLSHQFQQTNQILTDELTLLESSTTDTSKRWDANIDSKVVFDRAQDLVKRHLYKCGDSIGQKDVRKRNAAKKNFICTTKKTDVYEPQCNELDEDEHPDKVPSRLKDKTTIPHHT